MSKTEIPTELISALLSADGTGRILIPTGTKLEMDAYLSVLNNLKRRGLVTRETVEINYSPHLLTPEGKLLWNSIRETTGLNAEARVMVVTPSSVGTETTITCICGHKITRDRAWFRTNRRSWCTRCNAMHVIEDVKNVVENNEQLTKAIENFRKRTSVRSHNHKSPPIR